MAGLMFHYLEMPFHSRWKYTDLKQINYYYNRQHLVLQECQALLIILGRFKMMELNLRSLPIISGKGISNGLLQPTYRGPDTRYYNWVTNLYCRTWAKELKYIKTRLEGH